jgi:hypothetical protein
VCTARHAGQVGQVPPGPVRQLRAEFQRGDQQPPLGQRAGGLPGARPDLQDPGAGSQPGDGYRVVEDLRRADEPAPVVGIRVLIERRPEELAFLGRAFPRIAEGHRIAGRGSGIGHGR